MVNFENSVVYGLWCTDPTIKEFYVGYYRTSMVADDPVHVGVRVLLENSSTIVPRNQAIHMVRTHENRTTHAPASSR